MVKRRNAYEARHFAEIIEQGKRTVRKHTCRHCNALCLRGQDDDRCAYTATVDITPISLTDEMEVLLHGLSTYDIAPATGPNSVRGTYVLYFRDHYHYQTAERKYPVLAEHCCWPREGWTE